MHKAKLIFIVIAVLAATRLAATPAFGQSYNAGYGTGNVLPSRAQPVTPDIRSNHLTARTPRHPRGLNSYAMEPSSPSDMNSNSPA
ncbi:MAG TPA: hypothetical protein VFP79_19290, partial [Pseudolabrys sp.]|nr:hypothetical protein [Pseudolabrys sp.]